MKNGPPRAIGAGEIANAAIFLEALHGDGTVLCS